MNMFSMKRPLPSIETLTPAYFEHCHPIEGYELADLIRVEYLGRAVAQYRLIQSLNAEMI